MNTKRKGIIGMKGGLKSLDTAVKP